MVTPRICIKLVVKFGDIFKCGARKVWSNLCWDFWEFVEMVLALDVKLWLIWFEISVCIILLIAQGPELQNVKNHSHIEMLRGKRSWIINFNRRFTTKNIPRSFYLMRNFQSSRWHTNFKMTPILRHNQKTWPRTFRDNMPHHQLLIERQ